MLSRLVAATIPASVVLIAAAAVAQDGTIVRVGAGSYALTSPPGARTPQAAAYVVEGWRGPIPTTDWWSSLVWVPRSAPQYAHPLALRGVPAGLQAFYPGPVIHANEVGIFGAMGPEPNDLVIGHSEVAAFPEARLAAASDWFVTARCEHEGKAMEASYGHGSPYVYFAFEGGNARVRLGGEPSVWAREGEGATVGLTVNGKAYGLFGPTGSRWAEGAGRELVCELNGRGYCSIALLTGPDLRTLRLFDRHAHAHVTGTTAQWEYDEKTSVVTVRYRFDVTPREGEERQTLLALYPHQWEALDREASGAELPGATYESVRGEMKLLRGLGFTTRMVFPGVLPVLPDVGEYDRGLVRSFIAQEADAPRRGTADTYWEGKLLGKLATLVGVADELGDESKPRLLAELKRRLEGWLEAGEAGDGSFHLDGTWGALIGYPASYGTDTDLSDHHFHYGYFIRAAAEIARQDPEWASPERWGGMVEMLIRDIACPERDHAQFPFLRCLDPYAGHSWASGKADFHDGNNQESSSEAMNAWTGLILWGEATGNRAIRDLGIYLYTTELAAINSYWFDVGDAHHHTQYPRCLVAMVWGGKGVHETWFSRQPAAVHGINWLPFHGGSLYLGQYPEYARRNHAELVRESGGERDFWPDLVLMYQALFDAPGAALRLDAEGQTVPIEAGNSRGNLHYWVRNLRGLGTVDRSVTADCPLYAVFDGGAGRVHVAYNMLDQPRAVSFSDGARLVAPPRGFAVEGAAGP